MKKIILITTTLLAIACENEPVYVNESETSSIVTDDDHYADSIEKIINFITYIDSAQVVEKISDDIVETKQSNEKLKSELKATTKELHKTKRELVETRVTLLETKQILKQVFNDSIDSTSNFKLLPIEQ